MNPNLYIPIKFYTAENKYYAKRRMSGIPDLHYCSILITNASLLFQEGGFFFTADFLNQLIKNCDFIPTSYEESFSKTRTDVGSCKKIYSKFKKPVPTLYSLAAKTAIGKTSQNPASNLCNLPKFTTEAKKISETPEKIAAIFPITNRGIKHDEHEQAKIFVKEMITMKESMYKSYDELPLFLKTRAPAGTQRSGSGGKRKRSGMSEAYRLRRDERYGACADEVPKEKFREWVEKNTGGVNEG